MPTPGCTWMGLVDYADSDSEQEGDASISDAASVVVDSSKHTESKQETATKRKLLPPLDDGLVPRGTADGSTTSKRPKVVAGEWLCHVFVEVPPHQLLLDRVIRQCHEHARASFGSRFTPIGSFIADTGVLGSGGDGIAAAPDEGERRPHISLTRPILLRAHERTMFVDEAANAIRIASRAFGLARFPVSFSRLTHLTNDDLTRDFLVLEVGTGWKELKTLADSLSTSLHRLVRARPYYQEARFHASIGFVSVGGDDDGAAFALTLEGGDGSLEYDDVVSTPMAPTPTRNEDGILDNNRIFDEAEGVAFERADAVRCAERPATAANPVPLETFAGTLQDTLAAEVLGCPPFAVGSVGIRVGKMVSWVDL